jgi:hypothetical protein
MSPTARLGALSGSVVVHVLLALCTLAVVPVPRERATPIAGRPAVVVRDEGAKAARPMAAQRARRDLVRHARELRTRGDLRLGAFFLAANAIDAAEEGATFDLDRASVLYQERLGDLTRALKRRLPEDAVPTVFGDLAYAGLPGGRMGDTLVTGSGSCEPLSHLVVATLYDAGHHEVRFRYYGGPSSGVTHLAPVLPSKDGERDLVTGTLSLNGGTSFGADEIIDAYARAHGLDGEPRAVPGASPPSGGGGAEVGGLFKGLATATRSMTAGYPSNPDRFAGALPLYAGRAISPPLAPGEKADEPASLPDYSTNCAALVKPGELDPPHAIVVLSDDTVGVDLYRVPSDEELDRISTYLSQIDGEKKRPGASREERLVLDGCLAALYDRASIEFALAGERAVATRGALEAGEARRDGDEILKTIALDGDGGKASFETIAKTYGRDAWVLLFLPGGDAPTLRLAEAAEGDTFAGVSFMTALLVNATTRERALRIADTLDIDRQIEIMHELAHAHDNARPWSAAYELDLPEGSTYESGFFRAYQVFMPMSWRFWEATRPATETLDALIREAHKQNLDEKTVRALVGYYVRNVIWIASKRENAGEVMSHVDTWLREHGMGPLLTFNEMKPTSVDAEHIKESLDAYAAQQGKPDR